MKKMFLSFGICVVALISLSATTKAKSTCMQEVYNILRYNCGDVLTGVDYWERTSGCTSSPYINLVGGSDMALPCTHLHPPGGKY